MATELGVAYLSIVASTKDLAPSVRKSLGQVETDATSTGKRAGSSLGSSLTGALKVVGAGIAGVTALVGGLTLGGGIARALSIENAQAKLTGLGHTAADVTEIMNNALASVKGTAFSLGDAATVSASLVAAGIKQGPALTGILKSVADTATISGRSLTDIGAIFGSVAARGKLQGDDMLQLMQSGVPVLQFLSAQLGVSSADISKMVSKGQIDFATFAAAMQAGMGGAALASGTTFTGSLANVRAALSRLGAEVATPALASLKGIFNDAIPAIDALGAKLAPLISSLADRFGPVIADVAQKFFTFITNADFTSILHGVSGLVPALGPLVGLLGAVTGSSLSGLLGPLGAILPTISGPLGLIVGLIGSMLTQSPALRAALGDVFAAIGSVLQNLTPVFSAVVGVVAQLVSILAGALASAIATTIVPMIQDFASNVLPPLIPMLTQIVQAFAQLIPPLVQLDFAFAPLIPVLLQLVIALLPALLELLNAVLPPLISYVNAIAPAIAQVITVVAQWVAALAPLITTLSVFLVDAIVSYIHWLISAASAVVRFGVQSTAAVADFAARVSQDITNVVGFFVNLPGRILGAFVGANTLLINIGKSIIEGLITGITSAFQKVKDTLSNLTSLLPDWKGPASLDAKLLTGNGRLIMQSLVAGFQAEAPAVHNYLAGFTTDLAASGNANVKIGGSGAGSNGITINATANPLLAKHYAEDVARATEVAWRDANATAGVA